MSAKERRRAVIMAGVQAGELNLVGAAAVLGLSYRQTKRVWRRYRTAGDAGLVHRLRGRPGPRRQAPELRAQVLARVAARYPDFGPTLAAEYLAQEGWRVDHETL
ncbi:MAG TPA: helix-turn-helix domain-containing protein, partial [Verrucomicrobiota bacterium]|nr:helix-turn-helix domain-containing protein [Verrucomicrobiota bacterium]